MKKAIVYIIIALVSTAIVVIRLKSNKEKTLNRVYQFDKEQAINVQVTTLTPQIIDNTISYSGTFEPHKETKLSADIQGRVISVFADAGTYVRKGDVVIQLDDALLRLQLQSIEIQIEGLEADVERYTVLADADAIQRVQLEKAEMGLRSAKVQKAILTEQISKTSIRSPFSGIITARLTEEGAFAAPGIPLLQITDISRLKFTINIPEDELFLFKLNQSYTISADAYPETVMSGKVIMTGSKANMGSSFPVQFSVNNTADMNIKSGMFGRVQLKSFTDDKHIIIPASSIAGTNIQPQVYIVKNGKAFLKYITISSRFQNKAVVSYGLAGGDVIVTNGFINLFDGANVNFK